MRRDQVTHAEVKQGGALWSKPLPSHPQSPRSALEALPAHVLLHVVLPFAGTVRDLLALRATCTSLSDTVDSDYSLWAHATFPLPASNAARDADRAFKHHALIAACTNNPTAIYSLLVHEWRGLCKLVNGSALAGSAGDGLLSEDPSQLFSDALAALVAETAQVLGPPSPGRRRKWSFLGCLHETMVARLWTCLVLMASVRSRDFSVRREAMVATYTSWVMQLVSCVARSLNSGNSRSPATSTKTQRECELCSV